MNSPNLSFPYYKALFFQLVRFGLVGTIAALAHMFCMFGLVELGKLAPLLANIFAFAIAFNVSLYGHHRWTFSSAKHYRTTAWRLLCVALVGFSLNEGLLFFFLHFLHLQYMLALLIVLFLIPPLTFLSSKLWVFQ